MHNLSPKSRVFSALLFVCALLATPAAYSADPPAKPAPDTVLFKNGDQLTGKLLRADGGTVTFHSDVVGDVKIDWDKIKELHTPQTFAVLKNGQKVVHKMPTTQVAEGTLNVSDETIQVHGTSSSATPIATKDAAHVINAADFEKQVHYQPNFFHDWNGTVTGGASTVTSTQNSEAFNIGIALIRTIPTVDWMAPRNRTTADFLDSYGKVTQTNTAPPGEPSNAQNIKTSIYHADAERDEYLSERFYALADTSFDHNFSQGLDLQQLYGGGFGFTVIKQPKQELDTKIDVHYEKQAFSGAPSINLVGSTFGETYMRKLPKGLILNETGLVDFSFNNTNAYSSDVTGAIIFPVYKRLAFNVGVVDDYLNNPPVGFNNNSFQFTTGVTYSLR